MVAYSFKKQFAEPILLGRKRQTIRADRRRHARVGEEMQLYIGMRTKQCRLLSRVVCIKVDFIAISVLGGCAMVGAPTTDPNVLGMVDLDVEQLARDDGFENWGQMREFWLVNHPPCRDNELFKGVRLRW